MDKKYDVYAVGNALMDFLVEVDDALLEGLGLVKGQFALVDNDKSKEILDKIRYGEMTIRAGGSAANAAATVALLGGKAAFFSAVGDDEYGAQYADEMRGAGVTVAFGKRDIVTGHCIVFVTKDAERTFVVNYGAATHVDHSEIVEDDIAASKIVHVEGYMLSDPKLLSVGERAMQLAKKHDVLVSFDVNDAGVVGQHKEKIVGLLKEYGDIVFANDEEAKALTGKDAEEAAQELGEWCSTAVVKMGEKGSIIVQDGAVTFIDVFPAEAVDTTGAGDAYAAGFLYGIANNMGVEESGKLASMLGAKVVSQMGARLGPEIVKGI